MRTVKMILILVVLTGCHRSPSLSLSRDHNANRDAIGSILPKGTSISKAEDIMKSHGFDWDLRTNESVNLAKGSTIVGDTGPLTFAVCTRLSEDTIWTATIIFNENLVVEDLDINSRTNK